MRKMPVRGLVVLVALAGFFLVGHFLAPELADDQTGQPAAPLPEASWTELQDFFDECLTMPVAWQAWRGESEGGLVVVLGSMVERGQFQVVACFEGADMAALVAAGGPARHIEGLLGSGVEVGELMLTSCGTGALDSATRQRFQAEFEARFMLGGKK